MFQPPGPIPTSSHRTSDNEPARFPPQPNVPRSGLTRPCGTPIDVRAVTFEGPRPGERHGTVWRGLAGLAAMAFLIGCGAQEGGSSAPALRPSAPHATRSPVAESTPTPFTPRSASSAAPRQRVSKYTTLKTCRVVEANPEEAAYRKLSCDGLGGFALRVIDADDRQNLFVVAPDGTSTSLRLSEIGGGGFSRLGDTIEWRGRMQEGRFRPDAMVLRYFVVEAEGEGETSVLLPVSLASGSPCVTARVAPGPGQSDRARALVDAPMRCPDALPRVR